MESPGLQILEEEIIISHGLGKVALGEVRTGDAVAYISLNISM